MGNGSIFILLGGGAFFLLCAAWYYQPAPRRRKDPIEEAHPVQRALGNAIGEIMHKKFTEQPHQPLTNTGFRWAFYYWMRARWRDADMKTTNAFLDEELEAAEIRLGQPGHSWTSATAKEMVDEMVAEYGEN